MARARKDGEKISFYIDRQVLEVLRAYAEEKGQTVIETESRFKRKLLSIQYGMNDN